VSVAVAGELDRPGAPAIARRRAAVIAGVTALAAALGGLPLVTSYYVVYLVSLVAISAVIVVGLDVLMGYAGQVSLGQAGFAAIGAYVGVLLVTGAGLPWALALPAAGLAAALVGVAVSLPSLRLSPLYIATVTFGFGQIVQIVLVHWEAVTHGPDGLAVPRPAPGGRPLDQTAIYYVIVLLSAVMLLSALNLVRSLRGRALVALRESEPGALAVGIPVAGYKTWAFAFGAFYAAVGGVLYGWLTAFISPDAFGFDQSLLYVTMAVVGGLGQFWGGLVGAAALTLLNEVLRPTGVYRQLALGLCLLGAMLFMPGGLWGAAVAGWRRLARGAGA
jgi:branched-chain amino acid transport system permease protein